MPKQPTQPAKRGRPAKPQHPVAGTKRKAPQQPARQKSGPFELSDSDAPTGRAGNDEDGDGVEEAAEEEEEEAESPENTIPPELLTRLLHEFFEKDDTRLSKPANAAAGKYMDIFVREAIARCVHERPGGFLEVEDLEKIAPQLLMDF
ncbi:Centromere protein X [Colletotrichum chlorophyti]|uniref:Centromere protein X n=1 Tax=Colletotrichum chlorophyti TaxID=708187 RepID=A0A1Q8RS68_9PEZI|nr:Centromere protein X [Colletotrichum chlorophyti]